MKFSVKTALFLTMTIIATLTVPAVGQPERGIDVGGKIKPRQVENIDQETFTLPSESGLTVLLFWSTWSPRSERALKLWERYSDDYKEHDVKVISVNADHQDMQSEDIQKIRDYLTEKEVGLPVVVDTQLELFNEIGVIVLPTTLILKPDGTLDYKYAGFPSSAEIDLKEDLELKLGIAEEPAREEEASRGKLAYQPKNNALLFYNMGVRIQEKGFPEKAKAKYIEALQKDPEYADPLRALEQLFFAKGRTTETEKRLKVLLTSSGLENVVEKISEASPVVDGEQEAAPGTTTHADLSPATAGTPKVKKLTPMERMRLLMEKKGN